jgi:hypothetical protein
MSLRVACGEMELNVQLRNFSWHSFREWEGQMSGQSAAKLVRIAAPHSIGVSANLTAPPHRAIAELVEQFRVRWVMLPGVTSDETEIHQVGFVFELHGTHEQRGEHPTRDCERCRRVYAALRVIADWIFPCEGRSSTCEIEIHSPFISGSSARANQAGAKLTVRVVRHAGGDRIVCGCEPHCAQKIEERLKALGSSELIVERVRAFYATGG